MGKREKGPPPPAPPRPFNAAFAGLAAKLGLPAPSPPPPPAPRVAAAPGASVAPRPAAASSPPALPAPPAPPSTPRGGPPRAGPARAVVRMERAGRGGKVVTVVEKLGLPPRQLERWLSELKRSLGCGGVVERDALVLQGDNRDRVGALLEARGVRKVTVA